MAISQMDLMNSKNEFNQVLGQQKGSALDKDSFMLLLVTQFKYQDPLNPMEDKEFIAQLAQFSSLEQLMNLNDSMGLLTDATNNQQMLNATSYIGKTVMAFGTSISKKGDAVTKYEYALEENAATGIINVYDSKTNEWVYSEDVGAQQAGKHSFEWNGKKTSGLDAPEGVYVVRMAFQNAKGVPIITDSQVEGVVEGVANENGTIFLKLEDGRVVSLANVRQVGAVKPKEPAKPDDGTEEKPEQHNDLNKMLQNVNKQITNVSEDVQDKAQNLYDNLQEKAQSIHDNIQNKVNQGGVGA